MYVSKYVIYVVDLDILSEYNINYSSLLLVLIIISKKLVRLSPMPAGYGLSPEYISWTMRF